MLGKKGRLQLLILKRPTKTYDRLDERQGTDCDKAGYLSAWFGVSFNVSFSTYVLLERSI
jgi:hypothetical protein